MRDRPIGVMDSGVGGLTVVAELWRQLPNEAVLFYGDSARCPYGERDEAEILDLTFRALDELERAGVKMMVIACNTATAVALAQARQRYRAPVFGVIAPGARAAIAATNTRRVGVIGTRATIRSESYAEALHVTNPWIDVHSHACPELVELAEGGPARLEKALPIVRAALEPFSHVEIDTMILGCTHFPLLSEAIGQVVGPGVKLISSAEETAREVSLWLADNEMTRTDLRPPRHLFLTSGDVARFRQIGESWLSCEIQVEFYDVWDERDAHSGIGL